MNNGKSSIPLIFPQIDQSELDLQKTCKKKSTVFSLRCQILVDFITHERKLCRQIEDSYSQAIETINIEIVQQS